MSKENVTHIPPVAVKQFLMARENFVPYIHRLLDHKSPAEIDAILFGENKPEIKIGMLVRTKGFVEIPEFNRLSVSDVSSSNLTITLPEGVTEETLGKFDFALQVGIIHYGDSRDNLADGIGEHVIAITSQVRLVDDFKRAGVPALTIETMASIVNLNNFMQRPHLSRHNSLGNLSGATAAASSLPGHSSSMSSLPYFPAQTPPLSRSNSTTSLTTSSDSGASPLSARSTSSSPALPASLSGSATSLPNISRPSSVDLDRSGRSSPASSSSGSLNNSTTSLPSRNSLSGIAGYSAPTPKTVMTPPATPIARRRGDSVAPTRGAAGIIAAKGQPDPSGGKQL